MSAGFAPWDNIRVSGFGIGDDGALHAVDFFHEFGCDDVSWSSFCKELSFLHGEDVVGISDGQVYVVENRYYGCLFGFVELCKTVKDLHLISNVKIERIVAAKASAVGEGPALGLPQRRRRLPLQALLARRAPGQGRLAAAAL